MTKKNQAPSRNRKNCDEKLSAPDGDRMNSWQYIFVMSSGKVLLRRFSTLLALAFTFSVVFSCLAQAESKRTLISSANPKNLNLCSALPKSLAHSLIQSPGSCLGDHPSGGQSFQDIAGSAGYKSVIPSSGEYVVLNRYYIGKSLSGEIGDAKADIMQYSPSSFSEPKGVGQYAISTFKKYAKIRLYSSAWVSGSYEYTLDIFSSSITQANGLKAMRTIAHSTP